MRALVPLVLCLLPGMAFGQTDDRGFLTAFLEDNLSGAGRSITITGFAGALSSQATIAQLTIADDTGVWLTLTDVSLDWSRSALLSGALQVTALTAGEIVLERMPIADESGDLPSPEAGGFALPELPVSVDIGRVAAERIVLGESVLGEKVEGTLEGSLSLANGEGRGRLDLVRIDDGPAGEVILSASYANASRQLVLDLMAREEAGGVAVRLLGIPGSPSAALTISGGGPVDAFAADVKLETAGVPRLEGSVTLAGIDGTMGQRFVADLRGDLAPVFLLDYADFFGQEVALVAQGQLAPDGRTVLETFALTAQAVNLSGSVELAADGLPLRFAVAGRLGLPSGAPVTLPLTTEQRTAITSADLTLNYDSTTGEGWSGEATLRGLDRDDFRAAQVIVRGSGRISRVDTKSVVGGTLRFAANGLAPADPGLAEALGPDVTGNLVAFWQEGDGVLRIPRLEVSGQGYGFQTGGRIAGLSTGFEVSGRAEAQVEDLSRIALLAGRPLGGSGRVLIEGTGSRLAGTFDLTGRIEGTDLQTGLAELDGLLRGESVLDGSIRRDEAGVALRRLRVTANGLTADVTGTLASASSDLVAVLDVTDLAVLGGGYRGALTGQVRLTGTPQSATATLEGTGRNLAVGQSQADRLLAGESRVNLAVNLRDGVLVIDSATVTNPQIEVQARGRATGTSQTVDLTGRLQNLALLVPEFPGPLTLTGSLVQDAGGVQVDLRGQGPGQIDATVAGRLAADYRSADLAIRGTGQAALVNAFIDPRALSGGLQFDLALRGPVALSSLSGQVALTGGRLADPALDFGLEDLTLTARLGGARAVLDGAAELTTRGRLLIGGSVGLVAPFVADMTVGLERVELRDPNLYTTRANGELRVTGPLTGGALIAGRLALNETELRIPSSGFSANDMLEGLVHLREPAPVRATRVRAGLLGDGGNGGGRSGGVFGLDVLISAPNRVFIRGRGLDAELGGEVLLRGTTANVSPSGGLTLIRGRLDILGKRLDLSEAALQLEGDLNPVIAIAASNVSDGITSTVRIDGTAFDPVVSFTSSPQLPEEEVLARLLFDRGLQNLSALQAAQLANAVATLAGRGGEGIIGRLRSNFGLDNLDIQANGDGEAALTAGKYITRNIYTEITVDQTGKSQINLNLDLSPSVTLRGRASSDGTSGIGVFVEKDY